MSDYRHGGPVGPVRVIRLHRACYETVRQVDWDVPAPRSDALRAALGFVPALTPGPTVELTLRLCDGWDWIDWNRVLFPRWHEARARLSETKLHLRLAARALLRGT